MDTKVTICDAGLWIIAHTTGGLMVTREANLRLSNPGGAELSVNLLDDLPTLI